MARTIVLRFDATCFDCGSPIPAGSAARWFGKGRVSCCGAGAPNPIAGRASIDDAKRRGPFPAPRADANVPPLQVAPPGDSAAIFRAALDRARADAAAGVPVPLSSLVPQGAPAQHVDVPPYVPSAELQQLANATGITIAALASGLGASDVAILAERAPRQRLLVRLQSGARFIVPAEHCAHVVRCIEESCIDRVRDVALLAEQRP